jgi:hypothetical protein
MATFHADGIAVDCEVVEPVNNAIVTVYRLDKNKYTTVPISAIQAHPTTVWGYTTTAGWTRETKLADAVKGVLEQRAGGHMTSKILELRPVSLRQALAAVIMDTIVEDDLHERLQDWAQDNCAFYADEDCSILPLEELPMRALEQAIVDGITNHLDNNMELGAYVEFKLKETHA